MDPDLEKLIRAFSRFLPLLIPIAIIALPAILRALTQRPRPPGQGGQMPTPDSPPASMPAPGQNPEDDLVSQVRRMLEQRQGIPQAPPPAAPPRVALSRVPKPRIPAGASEDDVEARGVVHRAEPKAPRARGEQPSPESAVESSARRTGRPPRRRPATQFVTPTAHQSAAEQKEAQQAAARTPAEAPPAAAGAVVRATGTEGQELAEAIARNPLAALLAAEVFGPCRAASEFGEGPTSPVGLRGS